MVSHTSNPFFLTISIGIFICSLFNILFALSIWNPDPIDATTSPFVHPILGRSETVHVSSTSNEEKSVQLSQFHNPIQIENEKIGSPDWILSEPAMNREVEGYMSRTSVQKGDTILLYHNQNPTPNQMTQANTGTHTSNVKIEVFRTGWYGGVGARKVLGPIQVPGIVQKIPKEKDELIACKWRDPYVLETSLSWTTGVYLVKMTHEGSNAQSYAIFVLRDDHRAADIMFQLPFNTYQAYNIWGGKNLYRCTISKGCDPARKVSFDRPFAAPENKVGAFGTGAAEYLSNVQIKGQAYPIKTTASWNYNMVRWLERNNLDVSYIANADVHTRLPTLQNPKLFLTQGHDEYWSWAMRDHVTAWRDKGVNLAFLGSNTAYWQIRYEDIDRIRATNNAVHGASNNNTIQSTYDEEPRTVVCYRRKRRDSVKGQFASVKFRLIRPEALMVGVEYVFPLGDPFDEDMIVSDHSHWIFRGTGMKKGDKIPGMLGYEVDRIREEALSPMEGNTEEPITRISKIFETPLVNRKNNTFVSHGSMYQAQSGANVFGAGTMQWSWGLDDYGVEQGLRTSRLSNVIEMMTWNLLEAAGILGVPSKGNSNLLLATSSK